MNLMLADSILGEQKEMRYAHPFFGERIH
jgi:hypothetical protein